MLFNPSARATYKNIDLILESLHTEGFELFAPPIFDRASAAKMIRRYANEVDMVIAVGGDGTLNAVLQGLAGTKLPLGIIPCGTANDLCRTLGIPLEIAAACDVIARQYSRIVDIGRVNGVYYFNEASLGLSVTLTRLLTTDAKARFGILAHVMTAFFIMRRMRRFRTYVSADGGPETVLSSAQLTIGNSSNFGGLLANDEAAIDDRKLDLYSVEFRHWWSYFQAFVDLLQRRYDEAKSVHTVHARRFEVRTRRPMPIEADGEIVTRTPAVFEVVPRAIRVFVPAPEPVP